MTAQEFRADLSKSFIPTTVVVVIVAAVFTLGVAYTKLLWKTDTTGEMLLQVVSELREMRTEVRQIKVDLLAPPGVMLRTDLHKFCLQFERANRGLRCPSDI